MFLRKLVVSILALSVICSLAAGCSGEIDTASSKKTTAEQSNTSSLSSEGLIENSDSATSEVSTLEVSTLSPDIISSTASKSGSNITSSTRPAAAPGNNTNMQGYEFVLGKIWGGSWIPSDNSDAKVKALSSIYKQIENELNCKITLKALTPSTLVTQVTKAYQAGAKFADAVELSPYYFNSLVKSNFFIPVSDSKQININDKKWISSAKSFSTFNGKVYGLSWTTDVITSSARGGIYFNKTLAAQFGIEDLYKTVKDKKWTFSKLEEVLNTVSDKSGGKIKGLGGYDLPSMAQSYANANGGGFISENKGKYSFIGASNESVVGIEFLRKLYQNNHIRDTGKDNFINTVVKEFVDGKLFMLHADYYYSNRYFKSKMKDDYGFLPLPMGPNAKQYYGIYGESRFFTLMDSADRDKCATIFNKLSDKTLMSDWKSHALKNDFRDAESVDMVEINMNNPKIDMLGTLDLKAEIVFAALDKSVRQGSTAGNMSSIVSASQKWLDDFYQQK